MQVSTRSTAFSRGASPHHAPPVPAPFSSPSAHTPHPHATAAAAPRSCPTAHSCSHCSNTASCPTHSGSSGIGSRLRVACSAAAPLAQQQAEEPETSGHALFSWLQSVAAGPSHHSSHPFVCTRMDIPAPHTEASLAKNGAPQGSLDIKTVNMTTSAGRPLDVLVAQQGLVAGEVAITIPEELTVTLGGIFESEFVAELLTAGKLSELACLALYLMYEKKLGKESFWYPYIKELDKQRARGPSAVESPLLWEESELEELLQGSPLLPAVKVRLAGIHKEYEALDTVWFMAGSMFNKYPFDIPTEAFSFDLFKQAFAAVQASLVHLQGVAPARRFSLVPLGPPLLSYSTTCKAMLQYNPEAKAVQLVVDRDVKEGEPLVAWCGPQPNSRLLLNYGIVDEGNPYDKLQITATLPKTDPLFKLKLTRLGEASLATQQAFDISKAKPLPPLLLPYMRLAFATTPEQVERVSFEAGAGCSDPELEAVALSQLCGVVHRRVGCYRHATIEEDEHVIAHPESTPRQKIAARLIKIEKGILNAFREQIEQAQSSAHLPSKLDSTQEIVTWIQ
ncbi:MAG: hypothetical protein WDW36_008284 [Sanguina aurantia]